MLSRPHAAAILNLDGHLPSIRHLWKAFSGISASDEMFFPTALALLDILRSADESEVTKKPVAYTDWS